MLVRSTVALTLVPTLAAERNLKRRIGKRPPRSVCA
jgi:hypothetical protein